MEDNALEKIEDKFARYEKTGLACHSDFLSLTEQSEAARFVMAHSLDGLCFYGGFDSAERKLVLIGEEDEPPIKVLRVSLPKKKEGTLGHRDYLGAIMGLGVKREKTGDIIVGEDVTYIIVETELAEYLKDNLTSVGRVSVSCDVLDLKELPLPEVKVEDLELPVSSPRLDNVVSSTFKISRKIASEAISKGLVFVNDIECQKPDKVLKEGDKIVLRGKGKAFYGGIRGTSKKGHPYIAIKRYI